MLENICIRILILDISEKKSNHELYGFTVHEEYNFYIKHFWKNESYKCDLAIRYAEGSRLQKLKEKYFVILQNEINEKINIDKDMISKKFHENMNEFQMLNKDQGDIHKNGRSVSKIEFDNGSILYYKPHSLDKDIKYQQLYKYLCEKAGISCREVRCLSRQTYGWEENIENKSCNTKEEIERYYFRLGIHLFLGYALGATDLHGENIVAYGEHPVIIDMETYPGYITKNSGSSTEEKAEIKIREKIMTSVLNTGILPVLTWGTGNNRVLMSAVNMHGKIRTPFKMPVVKDDKTSNIHIEYEQVEFEIKECIVRLNGEVVNSEEYTGEIIRGFRMAYTEILQNQKLRNMLKTFFQGKSRVILRHTQQYYMYLFASFHPDYMKDRKQREELLQVLHKKGETQLQKELRDYEIQSLLELDIPYFEIDGNSKELILKGVPKGNWYIGVHGYKYLDGSNKKVLSKWAEVQKVTVKTSLVTGKPAVKSAKVSRQGTKRKVTVKFTVPKACDGTDWVLAKKVSQSEDGSYTYVSGYAYTKKNQTKTTVIFKNVKPGVYYLTGRAYVKGYAKNYTKWSEVKKVVVK